MEGLCDLHIHSNASDGSYAPKEIVGMAKDIGLKVISITDHDEVSGNKEAVEVGSKRNLLVIPGVELSANYAGGSLHLLGYFPKPQYEKLSSVLSWLHKVRNKRNIQIIEKLKKYGLFINIKQVKEKAGGKTIGRPHIAQVLVEQNYVKDIDEAFQLYLKKDAPCYIAKERLTIKQAISLIIEAKGAPVLAHPGLLNLNSSDLSTLIEDLLPQGLVGIEIFHSDHTPEMITLISQIREAYNLLGTGGTDFHGIAKPGVSLGTGRGNISIPAKIGLELAKYLHLKIPPTS